MDIGSFLIGKLTSILRNVPGIFPRVPDQYKHFLFRKNLKNKFIKEPVSHARPNTKIFGIGLSKTATSSLAKALRILGYKTVDWKIYGQKVIGWPEFYYADAATDTPCASQFESLYHTFDGSKFIYTTRDISGWKRSIKNHFGIESPDEFREEWGQEEFWERESGWGWYNAVRWIQIHECLYAHHNTWEDAYDAHDRRVHRFFQDKPEDRFLEINIPGGDGWPSLCQFLGHKIPDRSFPHLHRSNYS